MSAIIVGTDGSESAKQALQAAIEVANALDDKLVLVTAWRELHGRPGDRDPRRGPGARRPPDRSRRARLGTHRRLAVRKRVTRRSQSCAVPSSRHPGVVRPQRCVRDHRRRERSMR